jgi:tetratricopeptide (TPR) repeat protein
MIGVEVGCMPMKVHDRLAEQPLLSDVSQNIAEFSRQVAADPRNASAWSNLAVALRCSGEFGAAIALYRRALMLNPNDAAVMSNLAGALRAVGELEEAVKVARQAVEIAPDFLAGRFNLGLALEDSGELDASLNEYDFVLSVEPNRRDATMQRAFTLLKLGRLQEGFAEYEKRLVLEPMLRRNFKKPKWRGELFQNKTILLYSEQGLGDTFQFIRYARFVKERGGKVIVECPRTLMEVVASGEGIDEVIAQGGKLPDFDIQASLMSLPSVFGTTLESLPAERQYLSAPARESSGFAFKPTTDLRIGIAWKAGHDDVGAHNRNVPLGQFIQLLQIPGISFYSLQVPSPEELQPFYSANLVYDLGSKLRTFGDTANAIENLDLIISVDTALVHLGAALGKPTWILLPYASEWRWLQAGDHSPWYPTVRLFRQNRPMHWNDVFARVQNALHDVAALHS